MTTDRTTHTRSNPTAETTSDQPVAWRSRLHRRGIADAAIARAQIQPTRQGWTYPIAPDHSHRRFKAYPDRRGAKYLWTPAQPESLPLYDPAGDLAQHIAAAAGVVILAAGEPDVWALWSAGIFNATCTLAGEGVIPPPLIANLRAAGATTVRLYPDCDEAGLRHAGKLRAALSDTSIALEVYALPFEAGSKGDINTLLLDVGLDQLGAALEACAPLALPEPAPALIASPARQVGPRVASADLYERWCVEVVEAAAVATWQIAPANGKNLSRRNFSSPLRADRTPSAQWNYAAHGFKDYGAGGEFFSAKQCAELLGCQSWDDYKRDQAPAPAASLAPPNALHYAHGLPWTLTRFLLTAKHKTVDRRDLAPLLIVEFLHTVCAMPARVTVTAFVQRAAERGWSVDRRLVTAGLKQGAAAAMYRNEPIEGIDKQAIGAKLYNACFVFLPIGARLRALGAYLAPLLAAPRRAAATVGEIAAVMDEDSAGLDPLDAARAVTVTADAQDRAAHARRSARWLAVWDGLVRNILAGSYQPFMLEPQALSAPRLRAAVAHDHLAEGVEVRQIRALTGLSQNTVLALARDMALESVPQTATIPLDQVSDSVRARGLVISETNGLATIHTPNVFKRRDTLTEAEQRAARHQQARQRGRARGRLSRPQTATEAQERRDNVRHHAADDAAARRVIEMAGAPPRCRPPRRDPLDAWLDYQWSLAPPCASPYEPATGEVLTGRARWQAAFAMVRGGAPLPPAGEVTVGNVAPPPTLDRARRRKRR